MIVRTGDDSTVSINISTNSVPALLSIQTSEIEDKVRISSLFNNYD